jgi:hypothetical protein
VRLYYYLSYEKDSEIKGNKVEHKDIKQSFFADDATFVNDVSVKSFEKMSMWPSPPKISESIDTKQPIH